jgi:hypothetical protein
MPDMVKLPGGHGLDKKQTIALVAGIGLVGGYVILKRRNTGAAASAADAATSGTDGSAIDDGSGLDYGDSSGLYPYGDSTAVAGGYYDPYSGQYIGTGVGLPGPVVTTVSSNAAWAQQAEAYMTQLGYGPVTVGNAIGKYLSGQGLTPSQEAIVQAAITFEGQPPQPVPPPHLVPEPGHKPVTTVIANGHQTLYQIAHAHGDTENQVVVLNPHLGILVGTKKPVKKGTKVKV